MFRRTDPELVQASGRVAGQTGRALIVNWSKSKVQSAAAPGVENRLSVTLQQVPPSGVLGSDRLHSVHFLLPLVISFCHHFTMESKKCVLTNTNCKMDSLLVLLI